MVGPVFSNFRYLGDYYSNHRYHIGDIVYTNNSFYVFTGERFEEIGFEEETKEEVIRCEYCGRRIDPSYDTCRGCGAPW